MTTAPVMVLAAGGIPNLWLVLATLVGGALCAGSANAFNCYIDRDIDRVMKRTQNRPLVTGELTDREALVFAWVTGVASIAVLGFLTNWLAAALSLAAILFYVFVYTLLLKRRTPQNIVWGGAAGCMPVLIGWAAVTGSLDWAPVILFGIVFLWTPPHYWPLSMRYRDDYASVHVPMLAVVRGRTVGRAAGRALRLGDDRVLAAAHPDRGHGRALRGRRARCRASGSSSRRTACTRGRSATPRSADAGLPREHHLPDAGVPRGRHRPAAASADPSSARATAQSPRPS